MLSLTTLRRFVRGNILVFYGEPRFQEHIDWLRSRCQLRLVETPLNTKEFRASRRYLKNKFYGVPMKLHAYGVNTPSMIHLDCDTIVHGNVLELLKGDYDLLVAQWDDRRASEGEAYSVVKGNCERLGLPCWPLQMDGFCIFKNRSHLEFKTIYEDYLIKLLMGELPHYDEKHEKHVNLHAFNLAINRFRRDGYKVVRMPKGYHSYSTSAKYVQHLPNKEFATWMEQKMFTEQEERLKTVGA